MKEASIYLIHELIGNDQPSTDSIRTFGQLIEYDISNNKAIIAYKGAQLEVNTQLLNEFHGKANFYYTFIGDIFYQPNNKPILKARVYDELANFNSDIFEKVLMRRREFLSQDSSL